MPTDKASILVLSIEQSGVGSTVLCINFSDITNNFFCEDFVLNYSKRSSQCQYEYYDSFLSRTSLLFISSTGNGLIKEDWFLITNLKNSSGLIKGADKCSKGRTEVSEIVLYNKRSQQLNAGIQLFESAQKSPKFGRIGSEIRQVGVRDIFLFSTQLREGSSSLRL